MGFPLDVINSSLQELMPDLVDAFTKKHPALDKFFTQRGMEKAKGRYVEFPVVYGGPGRNNEIREGTTAIKGGRAQKTTKGSLYTNRVVRAYDVPRGDLAEANTEFDLVGILEQYPLAEVDAFREEFVTQLVLGGQTAIGLGGFFSLNGEQTYNPRGHGAENGLFSYATRAAQVTAGTAVHGIAASTVDNQGWTHGFGTISAFPTNGRRVMRDTYYDANAKGRTMGSIDIILADPTTYINYEDEHISHVRVMEVKGDRVEADPHAAGIQFIDGSGCMIYREEAIDLTSTLLPAAQREGGAAAGVAFMLNSKTFLARFHEDPEMAAKKIESGLISVEPLYRMQGEDSYRGELVIHFNMACRSLRNNAVVVGGAL
jgi:hypothetical protein